ncbi:MAG TPA: prepilin-type N-terminal cleavage/methylation domain-containing protein [Candidatus Tetragenococcus pullicola]|nr:prepilin-type N-terminal cleavage/methylation domain-containing protein [Candidatus Tetragenococcus pullicola]
MSHKGFTLMECLVALMVMSLILIGTTGIFAQSKQFRSLIYDRKEQEWQICLTQMEDKLAEGTYRSVSKNKLIITKINEDNQMTYDCEIKWSSNVHQMAISEKGGFEPILTQVYDVKFKKQEQKILLTVTFMNGEKKYAQWTIPPL